MKQAFASLQLGLQFPFAELQLRRLKAVMAEQPVPSYTVFVFSTEMSHVPAAKWPAQSAWTGGTSSIDIVQS